MNEYIGIRQFFTRQTFPNPDSSKFSTVKNLRRTVLYMCIKTHDSELRDQEEAGRTRRTNELFTCSTALNFVNALNKPP